MRLTTGSEPITVAVLGAGDRGTGYAEWIAAHPDRARVIAVADPIAAARDRIGDACRVPLSERFASWQEYLAGGRRADAVLICTQDAGHREPALAALALGYDVLLEKPIAPDPDQVREIAAAAAAAGTVFAVGHVLRYTPYTKALVALLRSGEIGDIVSIQHLEPVGWWHMAHSFVRGNWRNTAASSFMLLAKSCHDLDWLEFVAGRPIEQVASFGSLLHFRPENAPEGAAERCVDCPLVDACAYSAVRIYLAPGQAPDAWPASVLTTEHTREALEQAVSRGRWGRCVYHCDNDVVDHQVVALQFAGGATGTFTMTGFTPMSDRQTRIFGSQGMIEGDGRVIRHYDFRTREWIETDTTAGSSDERHGGGDSGLMDAFVSAVAASDPSLISSDAASSLSSHLAVFAAERSRLTGSVQRV